MDNETPVFIPPVLLSSYDEFKRLAKEAAVVVCTPEYFHSPFLTDKKRLRRVTLSALGVNVKGLALTFKYILDYNDLADRSGTWDEQVRDADDIMNGVMTYLESECNLVRGTVEAEPSLGTELFMRP